MRKAARKAREKGAWKAPTRGSDEPSAQNTDNGKYKAMLDGTRILEALT